MALILKVVNITTQLPIYFAPYLNIKQQLDDQSVWNASDWLFGLIANFMLHYAYNTRHNKMCAHFNTYVDW